MNGKDAQKLIQELSGNKGRLSLHRVYCQITGDSLAGGMFLAQCAYWTGKGSDPDGYFYKKHEEWQEECFISPHEVRKYTKICADMGILETCKRKIGNAPLIHYRVNFDKLVEVAAVHLDVSLDNQLFDNQNFDYQKVNGRELKSPQTDNGNFNNPIYKDTSLTTSTTTSEREQPTPQPPTPPADNIAPLSPALPADAPYTHPTVTVRRHSKAKLKMDATKVVNNYIPAGDGETAVEVYREVFEHQPTQHQMRTMNERITDLTKWREICQEWDLAGHRANNFKGLFDWYDGNRKYNDGKTTKRTNGPTFTEQDYEPTNHKPLTDAELAAIDF